ncbi:hypothetical protein [Rhodococcus sp. HS-D2]|uniref:hypothetical protein n=1 Tax=Rhodococcus sp. HS-D2 TaxID=1384636 RepID=UPI0007D9BDA2|nr:hypothetical protein [Rhodococcus sp. HS-D2]
MSDNVIDIITREVVDKVGPELEKKVQTVVHDVRTLIETEARERIDAAVAEIPQIAIRAAVRAAEQNQTLSVSVEGELMSIDPKADAKERAWRTFLQGALVTLVLAVGTAFTAALSAPGFDLLTWDSWKTAATAAGVAAMTTVVAYVQRFVQPPKGS